MGRAPATPSGLLTFTHGLRTDCTLLGQGEGLVYPPPPHTRGRALTCDVRSQCGGCGVRGEGGRWEGVRREGGRWEGEKWEDVSGVEIGGTGQGLLVIW